MKRFVIILVAGFFIMGTKASLVGADTTSWTTGGPYADVRVSGIKSLAMAEADPDIIYAGGSGLFKTIDGGHIWTKTGFPEGTVRIFAVFSDNPDIVYVVKDDGMYKSGDGGNTWTQKEWAGAEWVNTITIDPINPDIIYAGAGEPLGNYSGEIVGIFKSTDGGETWQEKEVSEELDLDAVAALLIDTDDPLCIYAGASNWGEKIYGFLKSIDGGETWTIKDIDSSYTGDKVAALAMSSAGFDPPVIYAVGGDMVYKSTDRGESWTRTNYLIPFEFPYRLRPEVLAVDPNNPDVVYASTDVWRKIGTELWRSEFYKSTDGGDTWSTKDDGLLENTIASIVIDPRNSDIYVRAGYVYKSTDGAESWHNLSQASIKGLAVHPTFSNTALAAVYGRGLAKTTDGGSSWDHLSSHIGTVTFDPQNPSTIWVGGDTCVYKSTDDGQNWMDIKFLECSPGPCQSVGSDILIKPDDSDCILVGTSGFDGVLARTTDGGATWQQLGSSTTALAVDPNDSDVVYMGKTIGQVFQYSNVWGSWSSIEITPAEEIGDVRDIEVDSDSDVYVAANSGLWRWDGSDWTELTGPPADSTTALAIDRSASPGIVYVGTEEEGVFVSQDEGSTWISFNEGLKERWISSEQSFVYYPIIKLALSNTKPKMLYADIADGTIWSSPAVDRTAPGIPKELTADRVSGQILLSWSKNIEPDLWYYKIYRSLSETFSSEDSVNIVLAPDTTWTDTGLTEGTIYYYVVSAVDGSRNESEFSNVAQATYVSGIYAEQALPVNYSLSQNYPNPFNPQTTIQFALPKDSFVNLEIYNIAGQLIRTLKKEKMAAGYHSIQWDGRNSHGQEMRSGIYFCRIKAGKFDQIKKMVLVK